MAEAAPLPLETAFSAAVFALLAAHQLGAPPAELRARAAAVALLWRALDRRN